MGRDVESMIRDLSELAVNMVKEEEKISVRTKAEEVAEERMLDILYPRRNDPSDEGSTHEKTLEVVKTGNGERDHTRDKLRQLLRKGKLDQRYVDLEVTQPTVPVVEIFSSQGMEEMDINFKDMFGSMFPKQKKKTQGKSCRGHENFGARRSTAFNRHGSGLSKRRLSGLNKTELFFWMKSIKIAGRDSSHGPDVSREGCSERSSSNCRGKYRDYQIRYGENRSYLVHCRRSVSYVQTGRPHPRASREISHTG